MLDKLLQPLKAKLAGRSGRKHTLAHFAVDEYGRSGIRLTCHKIGCNCEGFYTLQELVAIVEDIRGEDKEHGEQAA